MKECECGSLEFVAISSIEKTYDLREGSLFVVSETDMGIDGVIFCLPCGKEYDQGAFEWVD